MTAAIARNKMPWNAMTDYERAVCYYTLPKVVNPISYGIIVAYAVCLFEAIGALVIGVVLDNRTWTVAGTAAFIGIIVFGMIVFTVRAFVNEVRQRKALAAARNLPEAAEPDAEVPDPFANHLLLAYAVDAPSKVFLCQQGVPAFKYEVRRAARGRSWTIRSAADNVLRVHAAGGPRSFMFEAALPGRFNVYAEEECIGVIERKRSFSAPTVEITAQWPEPRTYVIKQQSIHWNNCIIGRIYFLRGMCYLDIDKHLYNDVLLAYFVMRI